MVHMCHIGIRRSAGFPVFLVPHADSVTTVDLPASKLARRKLEDAHDPQFVTHARPL